MSRNSYSLKLRQIMWQAWTFVKRNGFTLSEALKQAWALYRLHKKMIAGIVKFYYQKVDGTMREAWGTLNASLMPKMDPKTDKKTENATVQVYFDTEKQEFRCFKRANLVIA